MFLFEGTTLHRLPSNQPQRLHKQLALRSVRICQQSVLSEFHGASFCKVVLVELVRLHPQCGFQCYPFDNERQCYLRHNSYFGVSRPRYDCSVGQALKTVDIKSGFKKNRICYITRSAQLHLCNKLLNNKTNKPRTNTYSFRNKTLWRHGEITPRFEINFQPVHMTWTAISILLNRHPSCILQHFSIQKHQLLVVDFRLTTSQKKFFHLHYCFTRPRLIAL